MKVGVAEYNFSLRGCRPDRVDVASRDLVARDVDHIEFLPSLGYKIEYRGAEWRVEAFDAATLEVFCVVSQICKVLRYECDSRSEALKEPDFLQSGIAARTTVRLWHGYVYGENTKQRVPV